MLVEYRPSIRGVAGLPFRHSGLVLVWLVLPNAVTLLEHASKGR